MEEDNNIIIEEANKTTDKEFSGRQKFWISFLMGAVCCALILGIGLLVLVRTGSLGRFVSDAEMDYYNTIETEYGKYYTIMKMIDEDPLSEKSSEAINDEMLKSIVEATGDPYAEYFTAEEYAEFEKPFRSDYVGIGITVSDTDAGVTIISVMPGDPAEEAGIEAGDVIKSIDGVVPENTSEAVKMIAAEADKELNITIERNGQNMDIKVKTARIEMQTVGYQVVDGHPDIGYIRISSFGEDTAEDFRNAVKDLKNAGCEKFIIDLLNNSGGLTDASVDVADYLLPACKIMTDVMKDGSETVYNSDASSAEIEFVVLVNENTASASEILTGAIMDNNAGTVIGKKTYGKGVTQISHRFKDGSAVKLTVSEYYRPNGDKVNGNGITPDIEADIDNIMDVAIDELEE